jgi:hypothetical protein
VSEEFSDALAVRMKDRNGNAADIPTTPTSPLPCTLIFAGNFASFF